MPVEVLEKRILGGQIHGGWYFRLIFSSPACKFAVRNKSFSRAPSNNSCNVPNSVGNHCKYVLRKPNDGCRGMTKIQHDYQHKLEDTTDPPFRHVFLVQALSLLQWFQANPQRAGGCGSVADSPSWYREESCSGELDTGAEV